MKISRKTWVPEKIGDSKIMTKKNKKKKRTKNRNN